jgi:hypothetical protein
VRYPVRPGWALPSSDSAVPFRRSRRFSGRTSASTQEVAIVDPASTWRSAAACWSTASTTPLNRQNRHFDLGRCDAAVGTTRYDLCQGRRISAGTGFASFTFVEPRLPKRALGYHLLVLHRPRSLHQFLDEHRKFHDTPSTERTSSRVKSHSTLNSHVPLCTHTESHCAPTA